MVEYLKTKKGYFYKLKKNGEKKRISQEEYNKKNKTRKNKKIIGGGRTEADKINELKKKGKYAELIRGRSASSSGLTRDKPGRTQEDIIQEIIEKGKYNDWVKFGSQFGLTSDTLQTDIFLVRPYQYYDVDDKLVKVSMVGKTYRPDLNNIAVFKSHNVNPPTHVEQSKYRIVDVSKTLSTSGLTSCTGLAMIIGTKKFMTHLDVNTPTIPIIEAINEIIKTEGIVAGSLEPIIYVGSFYFNTSLTLEKAKEICSKVGIPETNYKIEDVCLTQTVSI